MRSDQVAAIISQHTGHEAGIVYQGRGGELHLVGVSENPGLALATRNLVLLCHECHVKVHQKEKST